MIGFIKRLFGYPCEICINGKTLTLSNEGKSKISCEVETNYGVSSRLCVSINKSSASIPIVYCPWCGRKL